MVKTIKRDARDLFANNAANGVPGTTLSCPVCSRDCSCSDQKILKICEVIPFTNPQRKIVNCTKCGFKGTAVIRD